MFQISDDMAAPISLDICGITKKCFMFQISDSIEPPISLDSCGVTKGCFLYPGGCQASSCHHAVTYKANPDSQTVDFEMVGSRTPAYMSLSFSHDEEMVCAYKCNFMFIVIIAIINTGMYFITHYCIALPPGGRHEHAFELF